MPPLSPDRRTPDPEEGAEHYILGMLTPEDAVAFEDHYITCPACAEIVEDADAFVRALRDAARRSTRRKN